MSVYQFLKRNILSLLWGAKPLTENVADDLRRSTSPTAKMNLILRFETGNGPRTIVAPGIPLALASDVAHEMIMAGHFAEFVDQLPRLSMAERIKQRRAEAAFAKEFSTTEKLVAANPAATAPMNIVKAEFLSVEPRRKHASAA